MSRSITGLSTALSDRYRLERELGAGGMATVYLAHDLKHDRHVALKVLRPELAAVIGADRFLAEIKTTANLQHPHILPLFDSGVVDGTVFYAMPFVEGETLRDLIAREKQLAVPDAVRIATEVASALDYAHRKGVIHRDIKPENILLHDGQALVADFGIALAATSADSRMTETGMSLGTPHYMSPEQAMGERDIGARTDIYALGCVLYEMLTGEPPFTGPTAQAIVARVMTEEPRSLTAQRNTIPPHVDAATRMALAKLPADRFASAKAFSEALGRTDFSLSHAHAPPPGKGAATARASSSRVRRAVPWMLAAAGLATSLWLASDRRTPAPAPMGRFAVAVAPEVNTTQNGQVLAVSPDGSRIVYVSTANNQLFSRMLGQLEPVPIPGTNNALSPFFSPDGEQVAFIEGTRLMKVALSGGPALPIADVRGVFYGGTWNANGEILFASEAGLYVVSAAGGVPTLLAAPDSASRETFRWPEFLPDGRTAVFAIWNRSEERLAAVTLGAGTVQRLDVIGSNPHYVAQGFLTFTLIGTYAGGGNSGPGGAGMGTVLAVPFDPDGLTVLGPSTPVADSVQVGVNSRTAKLGISRRGTIAYASGALGRTRLASVSRDGAVTELSPEERFFQGPRLSPDGRRIAVQVIDTDNEIWIFDLAGKTLSRLTFGGSARFPAWTPEGRSIVYTASASGRDQLQIVPADGSAPPETLFASDADLYVGGFTPDGKTLLTRETVRGRRRIAALSLDSPRTSVPLIENDFDNQTPSLSPDGRWVAYSSNESGRNEVYVRPFPTRGGKWQVSKNGGSEPRWSPTGREIFFRNGTAMLTAAVQSGESFSLGEVRELFTILATSNPLNAAYDVTRDGNHVIMASNVGTATQAVTVLHHWFDNNPARTK